MSATTGKHKNHHALHRALAGMDGFSLLELVTVIIVLGIILTIGAVSYANIRVSMNLQAAQKQVIAAIERAKLSARQENVDYQIVFTAGSDGAPGTYTFMHGVYDEVSSSWSMQPIDKSVSGEAVISAEGVPVIQLANAATLLSTETITFHPSGTMMFVSSIPGEETKQTVALSVGSRTVNISIDAQGAVTVE